jgi:hypothetical protein
MKRVPETICGVENQYYLFLECVCSVSYSACQHAKRMHRIILSSVAPLAPPYYKWDFSVENKKIIEHKMCFHFL